MIILHIFMAARALVLSALVLLFLPLVRPQYFVTLWTLPPFFALGRSALFSFSLSFLMYRDLFMICETVFRSTGHITNDTIDRMVRCWAVIPFTHYTSDLTLMTFFVVVMFEAFVAKISGAEEPRYTRYGVKVVIVHQVHIYTWLLVCTGTG